ncbi:S-adenosylmethionine decarboxylase [Flavobacterium amniphilum]|uniref:S-adenosylmethionine decarboxylase family protein n=1 Tax=Flavobacterium amniphilum TaxID=1834035 RepID=UPI00202A5353|nr:S-adenosylmethionine decarboxylase [Flavobacterium amniphilum]MCL9807142.1 S-adenosylmethionine decarboxylase [Flavobacterium amniphilum]
MQSEQNLLGLHILLTLETQSQEKLKNFDGFNVFAHELLEKYNLDKVGESFHVFENESFTSALCLMESHLCIHTWPEISRLTADIYLCNYSRDNTEKVKQIARDITCYFEGDIVKLIEVER